MGDERGNCDLSVTVTSSVSHADRTPTDRTFGHLPVTQPHMQTDLIKLMESSLAARESGRTLWKEITRLFIVPVFLTLFINMRIKLRSKQDRLDYRESKLSAITSVFYPMFNERHRPPSDTDYEQSTKGASTFLLWRVFLFRSHRHDQGNDHDHVTRFLSCNCSPLGF